MADRFRARGTRVRSAKRKTFWIGLGGVTAATAVAGSSGLLHATLNAAALAQRPFTVVRSIGSIWVGSDQSAASEDVLGAFGNAVVDDRAAGVGITAVPLPYTSISDSDWFQWIAFGYRFTFKDATGFSEGGFKRMDFDQRGQRKVPLGSDVVQVVENVGGLGLSFIWTQRLLCLAS